MNPIQAGHATIGTLAVLGIGAAAGGILVNAVLGWIAPELDTDRALLCVLIGALGGAVIAGVARSKRSTKR